MRLMIALGGNALGDTPLRQIENADHAAKMIADLAEAGHDIVLAHGNGPQVGMIARAFEGAHVPDIELPESGAMSEGYIGYHLTNAIDNVFRARGIEKDVVTVVTRVEVDPDDPAFLHPTKPIGSFLSEEDLWEAMAKHIPVLPDAAGRGMRRVVASPLPQDILETPSILALVESGALVIAGGGGGIPVIRTEKGYEGVTAVIDKDYTAEKLAELTDADLFIILTEVEYVSLRFGQPDEEKLTEITVSEAEQYIEEGHFGKGSMLPKVEAAVAFAKSGEDRVAVITSLEHAGEALTGGTRIRRDASWA